MMPGAYDAWCLIVVAMMPGDIRRAKRSERLLALWNLDITICALNQA